MGRKDTQRTIGALQVVSGLLSMYYGGGAGQGGGAYLLGSGIQNLSGDKHGTGYEQGSGAFLQDLGGYVGGAAAGQGLFGSGGIGSGGGILGGLGGILGGGKKSSGQQGAAAAPVGQITQTGQTPPLSFETPPVGGMSTPSAVASATPPPLTQTVSPLEQERLKMLLSPAWR